MTVFTASMISLGLLILFFVLLIVVDIIFRAVDEDPYLKEGGKNKDEENSSKDSK